MSLVGLDVHASQPHAAVLDTATGELRGVKLRMAPGRVVDFLAALPGPVRAVYEAGPTGFGLARAAADLGIDVRVVAAGKVPRASGDRVKTDRRDAERLARLLAAGELRFAFIPSVADEQFRDVIRAIEDCRGDLMRARHRLSKMLLRRDLRWGAPGSAWTQRHMNWLRSLRFEDVCSQATFVDYLSGVEMLVARRAALVAALEQVIPDSRHAPTIAALRCFRGIDTLWAAGLCAEIGDWRRFRPKQLSGFLGVVPTEHTSDTKRRQGSITKAGSTHARRLLVEAAHHYRHRPIVGDSLARRQHGQDPRVIEISWRAQRRLHQRWQVLRLQRCKPTGVVAIACARELAAFCWEAATLT
ncbi:MAG: IS110 family RNA-guided transposase [Solirubrobacteraceae bacterium]